MASGAPLNFAAAAVKESSAKKSPLRVVQLEGQVLLKIAKHCKENVGSGAVVTGQLLGLDVGQTLEVTDCFPFPVSARRRLLPRSCLARSPPPPPDPAASDRVRASCVQGNTGEDDADASPEGEGYQLEMMRCLREINVDNNMVGWYQSTVSGSYQVVEIIDTFVNYLENLERCICIVYDVSAALSGSLGLKAIRLTDAFVEAYREGALTAEKLRAKGLAWKDVFVEIPITVHNSPMAAALMAEIEGPAAATQLDFDRLGLGVGSVLEKNLEFLNDCLDDMVGEQNKLSQYHNMLRKHNQQVAQWKLARRQENQARRAAGEEPLSEEAPDDKFRKPAEPSQLDNLLLANQMSVYTSQISAAAGQAVEKLVLLNGLQKAL
jgi:translation initiation factor 3 subunit H